MFQPLSFRRKLLEQAESVTCHIMDKLPDNILLKIFTFIPHDELCLGVRMTCTRWHHISTDKELWECVEIADHMTEDRFTSLLAQVSGVVQEVDCSRSENLTEQAFRLMILTQFPKLTKLSMPVLASFPNDVYEGLAKSCPALKSLYNVRSNVDETCNPLFCQSLFPSLTVLNDLPTSSFGRIRNVVRNLDEKKRQIWKSHLEKVSSLCPEVTRYSCMRGMGYVDDDGLEAVSKLFPKLEAIEIRHCSITDKAWENFFQWQEKPNELKEIVLDKPGQLTDKSLQIIADLCPSLEKFKIARCMGITPAGVSYLSDACRSLAELHINNSESSLDKSKDLERKEIDDNCVASIATNATEMTMFRLFHSRVLTGAGVEAMCSGFPHLLGLMLYECEQVDDRCLKALSGLRWLRGLALIGCENITPAGVMDLMVTSHTLHRFTLHVSSGNRQFCVDQSDLWDKVYERIDEEGDKLKPAVLRRLALRGVGSSFLMLITVVCPQLTCLDLSEPNILNNYALGLVIRNCDVLRILDISSPDLQLNDALMEVISQAASHLKRLSLGCAAKNLSTEAIADVLRCCHSLCMLSLDVYGTSIDEGSLIEAGKQHHGGRCFCHLHPDCREDKDVNYRFISLHVTPIKYLDSVNVSIQD